jgi:hypothetical protein
MLIGKKDGFAFDVKRYKNEKYFVCLWFNQKRIGDKKKAGSISELISYYERFIENYKDLWEDKFHLLNDEKIFLDIVMFPFGLAAEDQERMMNRMNKFSFFSFDNQFNEFTFLLLYDAHKKVFRFIIYEMDAIKEPCYHSYEVSEGVFLETYKQLVVAYTNKLIE